jgi:hypothetical protein
MASRFVHHVISLVALACIVAMILACRQVVKVAERAGSDLWPNACDPEDSKALCTAVKTCFEEHPASTCREYERVANQLMKPNPLLGPNGAAEALKY